MVTPEDIVAAGTACRRALEPLVDRDWELVAGDLEWTCRFTLTHMLSAALYYSVNLAARSPERRNSGQADPTLPLAELVEALEGRAIVLAEVCRAAPPGARGYHSMGMADASGFAAMGCDELLIHTDDIMTGLGATFDAPRDVCSRVLARLFPWAPRDVEPWEGLRWANGRAALGDRSRLAAEWTWHCAPLEEWDGRDPTAS